MSFFERKESAQRQCGASLYSPPLVLQEVDQRAHDLGTSEGANRRGRAPSDDRVRVAESLHEHRKRSASPLAESTVSLIPSPAGSRDRARQPRPREVARAWREAGVPERVWLGSTHHAFHKGFKSGLLRAGAPPDAVDHLQAHVMLRAGAPPDAVDHLQGHVISGSRGRYIDPFVAYDLVEVVGRVPQWSPNHSSQYA